MSWWHNLGLPPLESLQENYPPEAVLSPLVVEPLPGKQSLLIGNMYTILKTHLFILCVCRLFLSWQSALEQRCPDNWGSTVLNMYIILGAIHGFHPFSIVCKQHIWGVLNVFLFPHAFYNQRPYNCTPLSIQRWFTWTVAPARTPVGEK